VSEEHAAVQEELTGLKEQYAALQQLEATTKVCRICLHAYDTRPTGVFPCPAPAWCCSSLLQDGGCCGVLCPADWHVLRCAVLLQDQLADVQAHYEATKSAAAAELTQKSAELDCMKNKLLTERTNNRRQMEMSAEVCLQRWLAQRCMHLGSPVTMPCSAVGNGAASILTRDSP
jgi:hypothetical protein